MRVPFRTFVSALLAVLIAAGVAACGSNGSTKAGSNGSATAKVVPGDHAAVQLHAMGSVAEASAAAQDRGIHFVCGTFSLSVTLTSACMVSDQGVVAVIAFDSTADLTYGLSGPAIDGEVTVPVDQTEVYGVEVALDRLTLSIKSGDTAIGTIAFGA